MLPVKIVTREYWNRIIERGRKRMKEISKTGLEGLKKDIKETKEDGDKRYYSQRLSGYVKNKVNNLDPEKLANNENKSFAKRCIRLIKALGGNLSILLGRFFQKNNQEMAIFVMKCGANFKMAIKWLLRHSIKVSKYAKTNILTNEFVDTINEYVQGAINQRDLLKKGIEIKKKIDEFLDKKVKAGNLKKCKSLIQKFVKINPLLSMALEVLDKARNINVKEIKETVKDAAWYMDKAIIAQEWIEEFLKSSLDNSLKVAIENKKWDIAKYMISCGADKELVLMDMIKDNSINEKISLLEKNGIATKGEIDGLKNKRTETKKEAKEEDKNKEVAKKEEKAEPLKKDVKVELPKKDVKVELPKKEAKVELPKKEAKVEPPKKEEKVEPLKKEANLAPPKKEEKVETLKKEVKVEPPKKEEEVKLPKKEEKEEVKVMEPENKEKEVPNIKSLKEKNRRLASAEILEMLKNEEKKENRKSSNKNKTKAKNRPKGIIVRLKLNDNVDHRRKTMEKEPDLPLSW